MNGKRLALLRAALAACLLLQQHQRARAADVDILGGAADYQRAYLEDSSKRRVVTGGRRSGKTEAFVVELVAVAKRGGRALYLSLTRLLAEETIWDRLTERLDRLGLTYTVNRSKLEIRLAGGGLIKLGGAKDKREIDKHRGKAWALVIVDECGAHPSALLKYLVEDSIGPTLRDHEGQLTLGGTPAPVLTGYWCAQAGPDGLRTSKCPRYDWTIALNPFFEGRVERVLREVREENGWDERSITYRREYLGEWVQDDSVLVYPYNPELNAAQQLPTTTASGYTLTGSRWRHVIGIDVGTTEQAMALVVLAGHPALTDDFLVHGEAHTKMLTDGLVERVRMLLRRFPHAQVVIDAGGMGAAHALELANAGIAFQPAKKTDKASAIRIAHDRVLAGRLKLLTVPSLDGVRKEWASLGWDDDHLQHHPDQADHYSDATLYALRAMHSWNTREDMERPKRVHEDPFEEEEAMALH